MTRFAPFPTTVNLSKPEWTSGVSPMERSMKVLIGVDGSSQGFSGARIVATLPLSASDEVIVASVIDRPFLIGRGVMSLRPPTSVLVARTLAA